MAIRRILLLLISIQCCRSAAQPFQFTAYTIKEGLSSNTANCIAKTPDGFLWIGTNNGLNRFDGNAFDVFRNNPADSSSIAGNDVQCIYTDRSNQLWVTTTSGLSCFNAVTQKFMNYAPDTLAMAKLGSSFPTLAEDARGKIWMGADYDLLVFDPVTKKFSSSGWGNFAASVKPVNGNHTRVVVLSLVAKNKDELWVLTTYGLFSVHILTRHFEYYPCSYKGITDFFGSSISYVDEYHNLWIGTFNQGLLWFNTNSKTWKQFRLPPPIHKKAQWDIAYGIKPWSGDSLILCANSCLLWFDRRREVFSLAVDAATNGNIPNTTFYNTLKDSNQYWLVAAGGIVQLKVKKPLFDFYPADALDGIYRIGVSPSRKELVLGEFYKKLVYYNPASGTANPITAAGKVMAAGFRTYSEFSSTEAYLSTGDDLYRVNPLTLTAARLPLPPKVFAESDYGVRNTVQDNQGNIWVRMNQQGIACYQRQTGQAAFSTFIPAAQNKEYNALYCDKLSNTLFASVKNEGLYIYNIDKKTVRHFRMNVLPSQKGATIVHITGNQNGLIYLAEANNGFFVYNTQQQTFKRYTVFDGLPSNNCFWLAVDTAAYVWIATVAGIARFNPATEQFSSYGSTNGHPGYADFIVADSAGHLYQPWQKGYYTWNCNDFVQPTPAGKLYLRRCLLENNILPVDSVYNFTAQQNNISFQFGCLQFTQNNPVNIEYRLNNGAWVETGSTGMVTFSNLASNSYQLQVREKNQPLQVLTINFIIHAPFYKRWWFIVLMVMGILLLAGFFISRRVATIRRQSAMKQKMAETEMMALRAQMNPHFIFNCISSIDNFILDNDKENASAWLNKFAKLIRSILDNSKQEVIPFWKDWETLHLYTELEQLRADNSFTCRMDADEALLNGHYRIPPLIVQPYVENAIHHGLKHRNDADGRLHITARLQKQQLIFTIEDNGIGRAKAAELKAFNKATHSSYGMQLSGERVQLFNAAPGNVTITDVKDAAGNAAGTKVQIVLSV